MSERFDKSWLDSPDAWRAVDGPLWNVLGSADPKGRDRLNREIRRSLFALSQRDKRDWTHRSTPAEREHPHLADGLPQHLGEDHHVMVSRADLDRMSAADLEDMHRQDHIDGPIDARTSG